MSSHFEIKELQSCWTCCDKIWYFLKVCSVGLWVQYINITIKILDIIHRPVFYLKLNSSLSVPHRKHITSPLRANRLMLSIGLWRCYINITITILDVIHRPGSYLIHDVPEARFCLRPQVEPTHVGPIGRTNLCLRRFHLKTETE
jgi:hypothetical protein